MKQPRTVGLYGMLLLGVAFVFGKVQGGFVPWFLFYALLAVVFYEAVIFTWVLYRVEVRRELSQRRLQAGAELVVSLTIRCPAFLPFAWLRVEDGVPAELRKTTQTGSKLLFPWFKREITFSYVCESLPRGRHEWRQVTLQSGDLFGLLQRAKRFRRVNEVLVYPKVQDFSGWNIRHERQTGEYVMPNRIGEEATSVIGVRDYVHGDRLGHIHWKTTARGMGLKTKEFARQTSNDLMFFLDRCEAAYGAVQHPLFERAVRLTASLIHFVVKRYFTAGLISYGEVPFELPAAHLSHTQLIIYEHLAEVKADGSVPMDQVLLRETIYLPHRTTVICVTPQVDPDVIDAVGHLHARGIRAEVFWIRSTPQLSDLEKIWFKSLQQMTLCVHLIHSDRLEDGVREGGMARA